MFSFTKIIDMVLHSQMMDTITEMTKIGQNNTFFLTVMKTRITCLQHTVSNKLYSYNIYIYIYSCVMITVAIVYHALTVHAANVYIWSNNMHE